MDLTEEYYKEITEENVNGPVFLTNTYLLDERVENGEDYIELYHSICDAIFTGDNECKIEALEILSSNSHIAGLVKHFLIRWIDMIAVNYSHNILDRSIEFMEAILRNPYTVNSDINIELKHVCQLLVSLLAGSINDEIRENGHYTELEQETSEYSTYDSNNIVSYGNGLIDNNNGMNLDEMSSDSNMKFDENNAMLIENFSMESEKTGRTLRDELLEGFEDFSSNKIKYENHDDVSKDSASNSVRNHDIEDEFNALLSTNCASTIKCSEEYVESVCKLIGMSSTKWYGVENYLSILIISEVENFLKVNRKIRSDTGEFLNLFKDIF